MSTLHELIRISHAARNARYIPATLARLDPQVRCARPSAGRLRRGPRAGASLLAAAAPTGFAPRTDGQPEVGVQQVVKASRG